MNFEHCIRCTICVENCPVFRVNPEFPGPKQAGPDSQRFRMTGEKSVDNWVSLCSQCKRCEVACPYGVNPAEIILNAQIKYAGEHMRSPVAIMFANNYYLGTLGSLAAPIANRIAATGFAKRIFNFAGISTYMPFPSFELMSMNKGRRKSGKGLKKVVFFYGCFLNFNRPDIGRKIRDLLVSLDLEVVMPSQVCCGLPALGNGQIDLARKFAAKNAAVFGEYINKGYDLIYSCTSCGLTLTHDYPGILGIASGKKIAENSYNINEYILRLVDENYISLDFKEANRKIAYHVPCHLRALGIGYPAVRLFAKIPGFECTVLDDCCCGLSGSYGFKRKNQETALKIGAQAAVAIKKSNSGAVVSDCGACRMQLAHLSGIPALDPIEIITDSLVIR
jgi:glycerol-3-phosphate dehydrogenase subunit C